MASEEIVVAGRCGSERVSSASASKGGGSRENRWPRKRVEVREKTDGLGKGWRFARKPMASEKAVGSR